jgi:hypothetical protein
MLDDDDDDDDEASVLCCDCFVGCDTSGEDALNFWIT